ncbi:LacI family DNA-binding transcriptional regulator [Anditalea andensis]|uniref:HTH lacI-type domain-containing protein n=1 Tax=Anditalea andensis TaxID=1048983 RepID=A0A074L361_9BACT|nr:LacI family DNA-binding transcriptional regulator [Anditalea andensis]KEO74318.1 hypothetical protein EL17_09325 [Anditalea andensis]
MSNSKNRIKDIAKLAGVSVGTVDRVLHERGKVSEVAMKKVQDALEKINYEPNLLARTLGTKKKHQIAVLIPNAESDEYWLQSKEGVEQAASEWAQYDFQIAYYFFDLSDKRSFNQVAEAVYQAQPDGILVSPIFYQETLPFLAFFKNKSVPYVLFNTNIPEVRAISFIGQNLYESGKVGGELASLGHQGYGTFAVLHIHEEIQNSVHLIEKEKGFRAYFEENHPGRILVKSLSLSSSQEDGITELLADPDLNGILVTTSKGISMIAALLEKSGRKGIKLVGYDLLENNIAYLKTGTIDFLIHQNPRRQAYLGINYLANHLLLKKVPPSEVLFPLEIITPQNVNSYLNYILKIY